MRLIFDRLRATELHSPPGPACLDELGIAAAVDGTAPRESIEHLSRCAACRTQVAHLARLVEDDSVAREVNRLEARGNLRWPPLRMLAGVAAAAALVVALLPLLPATDAGDGFRDETYAGAIAPVLTAPQTSAGVLASLRWSRVQGATEYRVTVFDEEGGLVWSAETADTTVPVPPDTKLVGGVPYWWRVEARVDFDRWSASELGTFTVNQP